MTYLDEGVAGWAEGSSRPAGAWEGQRCQLVVQVTGVGTPLTPLWLAGEAKGREVFGARELFQPEIFTNTSALVGCVGRSELTDPSAVGVPSGSHRPAGVAEHALVPDRDLALERLPCQLSPPGGCA